MSPGVKVVNLSLFDKRVSGFPLESMIFEMEFREVVLDGVTIQSHHDAVYFCLIITAEVTLNCKNLDIDPAIVRKLTKLLQKIKRRVGENSCITLPIIDGHRGHELQANLAVELRRLGFVIEDHRAQVTK